MGLLSAGMPSISIALADRIAAFVPTVSASRDPTWCAKRKRRRPESCHGSRRSRRDRTRQYLSGGITRLPAKTMTVMRASKPQSAARQSGSHEHECDERNSVCRQAQLRDLASDRTHSPSVPPRSGAIAASAASLRSVAFRILHSRHPIVVPQGADAPITSTWMIRPPGAGASVVSPPPTERG